MCRVCFPALCVCLLSNFSCKFCSYFSYVYGHFACVYVCAPCACSACSGQSMLDPPGLELQAVVGAGSCGI